MCDYIPGLLKRQRIFCYKMPLLMMPIADGAKFAIKECQHQFRYHQWNCSIFHKDSSVFGKKVLASKQD